jgi:hypothetical protein
VRRLSEKKSSWTEMLKPSYGPSHALSDFEKDIFSLLALFRQMDGTIVRKNMIKQRAVIGNICEAIKNTRTRISVKELRALSAQYGPSKKCTHTSNDVFDSHTFRFFVVVWSLPETVHIFKLFLSWNVVINIIDQSAFYFFRLFFEFMFGLKSTCLFHAQIKHPVFVCFVHRATQWDDV